MSATKRKAAIEAKASDSSKKRQRTSTSSTTPSSTTKPLLKSRTEPEQKSDRPAAKSVLSKEEVAFPRGGAGPLTLLEKKQIRAKATRDAEREVAQNAGDLFGNNGNAAADLDSEDSDIDLEDVKEGQTFAKKKSKKTKKTKTTRDNDSIPIKSISHSTLASGSLLLGCITSIDARGLSMALPNNLTGFVPLTSISKQLNASIEKALQDQSDEEDSEAENVGDNTDLRQMFQVGQLLRVALDTNAEDVTGKQESRKKIILSVQPEKVNTSIDKSMLVPGITLQAAIVSVEDHGAIVDIGLAENTPAFLPKKALPAKLDLASLQTGSVLLCTVTNTASKGKAVQLSADLISQKPAQIASSIDAYQPGTLVDILLTHVTDEGLAGKVIGLLDVTADVLHSTLFNDKAGFTEKYKIGDKITGRLIANFARIESKRMAFSVVENLIDFKPHIEDRLQISSVVDRAHVISIVHGLGVYLSLPSDARGFCHISRLSDKNVDMLSETTGPYKVGTDHQARIIDYNPIDGLYVVSLQKSVIDQPFLRLEDVKPGEKVTGTVEKLLLGSEGVKGVLVKLASGITGLVSVIHLSDSSLKNPETKFREGATVKARVLSVDTDKRRLDLTLKKSLVNSDQPVWSTWVDTIVNASTVGTLIKIQPSYAIVQFYGNIKGRLPVSEMSEAYIKDATEHFKAGQVLTVYAIKADIDRQRLTLSARDPTTAARQDMTALVPGTLVTGTVFEKSANDLQLRLTPSGTLAQLSLSHITDGSEKKRKSAFDKIRVGQKLEDVLLLEVKARSVVLSNKASLRTAAQEKKLLTSYDSVQEEAIVTGFVSNITEHRVFVRFAQGITGVLNQAQVPEDQMDIDDFGMKIMQPISARIVQIDYKGATPRFWLSMRTQSAPQPAPTPKPVVEEEQPEIQKDISEPVDEALTSYAELLAGGVFKVRVVSVKDTQLNVYIAKDVQGRVDVSEVYDSIADVADRKSPLRTFSKGQVLAARVLGLHNSRTYKFLPLSHRSSKNVVFEMSARPSVVSHADAAVLQLSDIKVGESYMAFVNNVADTALMVNISPAVRGRISGRDISDDLSIVGNLSRHFPIGSVVLATAIGVDIEKNHLDLSIKSSSSSKVLTYDSISVGDILSARVTKTTERSVIVQLSDNLVAVADLIDLADDYDLANPSRFQKGEIVKAYVLQVDQPNKRVSISLRPSKMLTAGIEAKDPELSLEKLNVGDVRRGFIANVSDKGVFVTLARGLTAFVRVTNLSDDYIKEWKDHFERDQLVQGKIVMVDKDSGHIQMTLKKAHINGDYKPPVTIRDIKQGDIVKGKIAQVESFGVFIVVNNSENVRGLCHRSEIADQRIEDVTKVGFAKGDEVKAKVLKVEPEKRRINFGLKASYFADLESDDEEVDVADEDMISETFEGGLQIDSDDGSDAGVSIDGGSLDVSDSDNDADPMDVDKPKGLSAGGFDWTGTSSTPVTTSTKTDEPKSKKKRKPEIFTDRTGETTLQSTDDFERILLSEPDNAQLWIQYMAFHVDLGDIDAARALARRALSSVGIANDSAKRAIWIALFNIENSFGDPTALQSTLESACVTMDPEQMHTSLLSILIQSDKLSEADDLFNTTLRKFTQTPQLYINYATFLFDKMEDPLRARALLPRALQALPPRAHFDITKQFAQLEFKTKTGVPEEGRTRFQGLVNLYPKRVDLFNIMIDNEIKLGDVEQVRGVFEQVLGKNLKPAKAKPFFKRWLEFETQNGDSKKIEEVKARAAAWVKNYAA